MASKMDMSFTSSHACQSAIRSAQITQSSRTFNSTIAFISIVYFRMDFNKSDMPSMHDDGVKFQSMHVPYAKNSRLVILLGVHGKKKKSKLASYQISCSKAENMPEMLEQQASTAGITYCSFHPAWHCVKHEQVLLG
ncbi:hypothetical protein AMTRI_Chr04g190750 [Amborella trichopoda]